MKTCCVYIIECTGKYFYIGSTGDFDTRRDRHLRSLRNGGHHNVNLQTKFDRHGEKSLRWGKIVCSNTAEARRIEQAYLSENSNNNLCLNIGLGSSGGDNLTRNPNKHVIVAKMTRTVRRSMSVLSVEEKREKFGVRGARNGMFGRTHSDEAKAIMREANVGRAPPNKGKRLTEDEKADLRRRTKPVCRAGVMNAFYGRSHSDESKAKSAQKHKDLYDNGWRPSNMRGVVCNGAQYESVSAAAKAYGITAGAVINRIKSDKYDFRYL